MSQTIQRQVAQKAIKLIEEHGWVQREGGDYGRGFCTWGAIIEASWAIAGSDMNAAGRASRATFERHPWGNDITTKNDAKTTTKADVIRALESIR